MSGGIEVCVGQIPADHLCVHLVGLFKVVGSRSLGTRWVEVEELQGRQPPMSCTSAPSNHLPDTPSSSPTTAHPLRLARQHHSRRRHEDVEAF